MNSVERVKKLCKDRKIPISRLEKELGFANGYISQLRKGVFPSNRLVEIAEYFGVSVDYLLGQTDGSGFGGGSATGAGFGNGSGCGGPIEKAPAPEGERETSDQDIPDENFIILSRNAKKLSPEKRKQLLDMAKIMFKEEFKD